MIKDTVLDDRLIAYRRGGEGMCSWCEENVRVPVYPENASAPQWVYMGNLPKTKHSVTGKSYHDMWEAQKIELLRALEMDEEKRFKHRLIIFIEQRGEGKCQIKGSKVLMFDGAVKKVEHVKVGDLLMGDDNAPRKVLSLANGIEEMFEIIPMRGESLTVTKDHILSLKESYGTNDGKTRITDISLKDFVAKTDRQKKRFTFYKPKTPFLFGHEYKPPFDPYLLGLWLADGRKKICVISVNNEHKEIIDYLSQTAVLLGCSLTKRNIQKNSADLVLNYNMNPSNKPNPINKYLSDIGVKNNKHVPHEWRTMNIEDRFQFLAGYIDGDGCKLNGNNPCFSVTSSLKVVMDGIEFIARSLGFSANKKKRSKFDKRTNKIYTCYDMLIGGDLDRIPVKLKNKQIKNRKVKNWNVTAIKEIKSVGEQEYYGFNLDGNGRYVTADFTVTHNSLKAVLIQLWKFFCFPRQRIMLSANSRDQVTFAHYDIIRDLIKNSPKLHAIVGKRNIKEKEIVLKDSKGAPISIIRCISSFSGIYSNITGFTFSEMFDLRNETFFSQIYGSTRNMPNALGVVDSTVSRQDHILHKLYKSYINKKDPKLFVSYKYSKEGHHSDYLNPNMTPEQIESYRATFPKQDFNRYILNLWTAGSNKYFDREQVEASRILGLDHQLGRHNEVVELLRQKNKMVEVENNMIDKFGNTAILPYSSEDVLGAIDERIWSIDSIMPLRTGQNAPQIARLEDFNELSRIYDSNWTILAGVDRADPEGKRANARTIFVLVAKGAIGSKSLVYNSATTLNYIYIVLHVADIYDHSLSGIKEVCLMSQQEMHGIDKITSERWGMWDLDEWCKENDIEFEMLYPNPNRQNAAFNELYFLYNTGRIKIPTLAVAGARHDDILEEEALMFEYNITYQKNVATRKKTLFGSPEKFKRHGVQDDALYALAWAIYGGREKGFDDLREIKGTHWFGDIYQPESMIGDW